MDKFSAVLYYISSIISLIGFAFFQANFEFVVVILLFNICMGVIDIAGDF